MKGVTYRNTGIPVQGSFARKSHENLAVTSIASTSLPIFTGSAMLSLLVGAHVEIGDNVAASAASMVLPAGVWVLDVPNGFTISVLQLAGSDSGQASVILTEV